VHARRPPGDTKPHVEFENAEETARTHARIVIPRKKIWLRIFLLVRVFEGKRRRQIPGQLVVGLEYFFFSLERMDSSIYTSASGVTRLRWHGIFYSSAAIGDWHGPLRRLLLPRGFPRPRPTEQEGKRTGAGERNVSLNERAWRPGWARLGLLLAPLFSCRPAGERTGAVGAFHVLRRS